MRFIQLRGLIKVIPPGEIVMINTSGRKFKAHPSYRPNNRSMDIEYLYNPAKAAFQYRVQIPGIAISMITIDVSETELRKFVNTGKPVLIRPQ